MTVSSVFADKTEYSRYHNDLSIVTTTIEVPNPVEGTTLNAVLFRLDGYGSVCAKTITLTIATTYTVVFDLNKDTYDTLGIYRAKQGDYVIQVTDSQGNMIQSSPFAISIVPVREFKEQWCKGVTFQDYEKLEPRVQPQIIIGIAVTEVSQNHFKGPFSLSLTIGTPSTLSWGGGQAIPINSNAPQTLLLQNLTEDFIMVDVNPSLLPATNTTESLYIDNGRMKDSAIIDQMRRATSWVQQQVVAKLEPEIVDTDPGINGYYDEVAIPETYYRPRSYNKWMSFKLPYPRLLYPGDLQVNGYFNQTLTATVPRAWLNWNEVTGICELVPSSSSTVIWSFYNSIFILAYLFNYASIPGFWHYRATVGLRDLWNERAIVRECIAKKCAYELLNSAGSAYRAGYAAQEESRDGVTSSVQFTSSAMYGVYGAHLTEYNKFLEKTMPGLRTRLCGPQYVTI